MRNFLYNKSDVLVAAVIVIVAIIIIWTRIGAIMNSDNPAAVTDPAKAAATTETPAATETPTDDNTVQPAEDPNAAATQTPTPDPAAQATPAAPTAGQEVTFKVTDEMSSGDVAVALRDAGLIASTEEFNTAVAAKSAETKLKSGTFKIPAGTSVDKIIDMLIA